MKVVIPELTCVEANGKRLQAKITGYNSDGKLPPPVDGEIRRPASDWPALKLFTRGIRFGPDDPAPVQTDELVEIKEYRVTETKTGRERVTGKTAEGVDIKEEICRFKPVLDLQINVGNNKRGPQWNLATNVSFKGHVIGAHLTDGEVMGGKRFFEPMNTSEKATADALADSVKPKPAAPPTLEELEARAKEADAAALKAKQDVEALKKTAPVKK